MINPNVIESALQKHDHLSQTIDDEISEFSIVKKNKIIRFIACEKRRSNLAEYIKINTADIITKGNFSS